nr:immunoglobulin light chain junction region [Macaca mulatta]
CMVWHNNVVLF